MTVDQISPMSLALFLAAMGLLPLLMIITTAFLKIAMVLMITRSALGVQQVPPNMAIYAIALAATLFVMAPIFMEMNQIRNTHAIDLSNTAKLGEMCGVAVHEAVRNVVGRRRRRDALRAPRAELVVPILAVELDAAVHSYEARRAPARPGAATKTAASRPTSRQRG